MTFIEQRGDLFAVPPDYALGHCVGNDFVMGAGIATEFARRYGRREWLIETSRGVGTCSHLPKSPDGADRDVFYLVTKPRSRTSKPTYQHLEASIVDMFRIATQHKIHKIAVPRLGCGLDGKDWDTVRTLIRKHQPDGVDVLVCCL